MNDADLTTFVFAQKAPHGHTGTQSGDGGAQSEAQVHNLRSRSQRSICGWVGVEKAGGSCFGQVSALLIWLVRCFSSRLCRVAPWGISVSRLADHVCFSKMCCCFGSAFVGGSSALFHFLRFRKRSSEACLMICSGRCAVCFQLSSSDALAYAVTACCFCHYDISGEAAS